jgi:GNAT superfamily N-acetyltransferase
MDFKGFNIRAMTAADLPAAMDIKQQEGWNQTTNDWRLLLEDAPGLCLVALHQERVVATVAAIGYEQQLAWIGMMLVQKDYRGLGLAKMLMKGILDRLEGYPIIKLDATPAGFPVYKKMGFEPEYTIYRMVLGPKQMPTTTGIQATPIDKAFLSDIVDYDNHIYGVKRQNLLRYLYQQSPDTAMAAGSKEAMKGFVLGRPGTNYHQLGPLMAESTDIAKDLVSSALQRLDRPVVVDVLQDKTDFINWLLKQGFTIQRELIRMYYKTNPTPGKLPNQFLISGPELG